MFDKVIIFILFFLIGEEVNYFFLNWNKDANDGILFDYLTFPFDGADLLFDKLCIIDSYCLFCLLIDFYVWNILS